MIYKQCSKLQFRFFQCLFVLFCFRKCRSIQGRLFQECILVSNNVQFVVLSDKGTKTWIIIISILGCVNCILSLFFFFLCRGSALRGRSWGKWTVSGLSSCIKKLWLLVISNISAQISEKICPLLTYLKLGLVLILMVDISCLGLSYFQKMSLTK